MLDKKTFLSVVKNTPLVSIDLIVRSEEDEILMGKRVNQPAAGYWFVPGGIIEKNETLEEAFQRITKAELGKTFHIGNSGLLGVFTHLYDTNFASEPEVTTHYVVLAYELRVTINLHQLPGDQHSNYRWIQKKGDLHNVHENSRVYFSHLPRR